MPNVSFDELTKALQGSGLPMDNAFNMRQAQVGARDKIGSQFGDRGAGDMNKGIMAQLDQIAQMDRKLAGVYSDPTSNLYIENAAAREGAIYGHQQTGYKQVGALADEQQNRLKQVDNDITEAERLYGDLTTAQAQAEAEEKRQVTQTKKKQTEAQKKATTVKTESGGDFELSKQQARQARNAKVNLKDAKAVSEFFNRSTPQFRQYMEDEGIDGKIKGDNLTAKQIKEARQKWEKEKSDASAKKSAETAAKKKAATSKSKGKERRELFPT